MISFMMVRTLVSLDTCHRERNILCFFYEDNRDNDDVNVGDGDPWPTKRSAIIGA